MAESKPLEIAIPPHKFVWDVNGHSNNEHPVDLFPAFPPEAIH
jgi:hypothetical protein